MEKPFLKDTFSRIHEYLRISLTPFCNFNCIYCKPLKYAPFKNARMNTEEVLTLSHWMINLGIKKIRFTGGEPLLFRDIDKVLEFTVAQGVQTAITTNGFLLHKYIDNLIDLGVKINISIDTLNPKKFCQITGVDAFHKVWEIIKYIIKRNYPIKLNIVLMKGINDDELIDFVRLTKDYDIHVRFIEFMPFNGNKWAWKFCITGNEILATIKQKFDIEKLNDKPNSVARSYRVPDFTGTFAIITSTSEPFCATCNRLRINYQGKLLYCLFDDIGVALLPFIKANDFEGFKKAVVEYVRKKPFMRAGKKLSSEITSFAMTELGG